MSQSITLRERIIRFFGGLTPAEVKAMERRAYESGMDDGNDEPVVNTLKGKALSAGYRNVKETPRDLSAISQEKAIEAAYRLWQTHPLARAIIEIWVDYICGEGADVVADNPDVQDLLDRFWFDPVNRLGDEEGLGEGLEEIARELYLFGEQVILTFERTGEDVSMIGDGLVRLGRVDPTQIYSLITDERNRQDVRAIRLKGPTGGADGPIYWLVREDRQGRSLPRMEGRQDLHAYTDRVKEANGRATAPVKTISGREWIVKGNDADRIQLQEAEQVKEIAAEGNCFYFRVNHISTGARGRPDLLPLIDWLDRFDQLFFDGAEHVSLLNMFSWDLQIEGGTENSPEPEMNLKAQATKVSKLKPGSVYAHNEKAVLEAKNPDLKTAELETIVRQLRVFIAGGARIPEHWVAEGGYTNRSTADAMGQPTFKMLARKQAYVRQILTKLCRYQIDVAVALGQLPEEVPVLDESGEPTDKMVPARKAFKVNMPDINVKDTSTAATTLTSIASAVVTLVSAQLLPKQPALELLAEAAKLLGVTLDIQAILKDLEGLPQVDPAILDLLKKLGQGNKDDEDPDEDQDEGDENDQGNGEEEEQ